MDRIYLDTCCVQRPLDELLIDRNRLEAEAVLTVLRQIESGRVMLLWSEVLDIETQRVSDPDRLRLIERCRQLASEMILVTPLIRERIGQLVQAGIPVMDPAHLACAESIPGIFLTTDDKLIRRAANLIGTIRCTVQNPLNWIAQELSHD